jgi:hypothetical protein
LCALCWATPLQKLAQVGRQIAAEIVQPLYAGVFLVASTMADPPVINVTSDTTSLTDQALSLLPTPLFATFHAGSLR